MAITPSRLGIKNPKSMSLPLYSANHLSPIYLHPDFAHSLPRKLVGLFVSAFGVGLVGLLLITLQTRAMEPRPEKPRGKEKSAIA